LTLEYGKGYTETTSYEYDAADQLLQMTPPNGSKVHFTYDVAHRLTGLSDASGNQIRLTLDQAGNVTRSSTYSAAGELVSAHNNAYDALGRVQSTDNDFPSSRASYLYDEDGNLTLLRDVLGRSTLKDYDRFGRLATETSPASAMGRPKPQTKYGYDLSDALVSVTDPRRMVTRYTIDGHGQTTRRVSPDTGVTQYVFDDAGNLTATTDARGSSTAFAYDVSGRATQVGDATFEYGENGTSAAGRLVSMVDRSGNTSFSYDSFGRLTLKTQTVSIGSVTRSFSLYYEYGVAGASKGLVTSITYPSGDRIAIDYHAFGRPERMTLHRKDSNSATPILSNIAYRPFSEPYAWDWGNATSDMANRYARTFDEAGRVKSYPIGHPAHLGSVRVIEYDAVGRIRLTSHSGRLSATKLDQRFSYDDLDRLTGAEGSSISQRFEYDLNGNRIRARFGATAYENTISTSSNQLSKTNGPHPAKNNEYDRAGNLLSDGTVNFEYNEKGRLSEAKTTQGKTVFHYNGLGQRVAKVSEDGSITYFVFGSPGRLLGEYDSLGVPLEETVYLGQMPIAVVKPQSKPARATSAVESELFYIYPDHVNTARAIVRARDNVMVWRWDNVDPFGVAQPDEHPEVAEKFRYDHRFPGQIFDRETNTNYNYYRDYDPQVGRYIESDPIGLAAGTNTYEYVNGNPMAVGDPTGEAPTKIAIWLVKICKTGIKRIRRVRYEEAVRLAKQGENLDSTRDMSKKISKAGSNGKGAIKDPVHPEPGTGSTDGRQPHYHANPRNGGHIFYNIATGLTIAGQVECDDCWYSYLAEGVDLFNPASLPKDIMDLTGNGKGDDE
jgi:RHS repeat-associated protein